MGFWNSIKKGVKGLGKIASKAAPIVGMIPGVGTAAAAGIGGLGGLLSGGGFSGALKGAAGGALGGLGGGLLGKAGGAGGILGKIGQAASKIGGGLGGLGGALGGALGGQGGIGGILQAAMPLLTGGAAILDARQSGKDTKRSRELTEQAMKMSQDEANRALQAWGANQGMRDAYRNVAMNFSDTTNPFARNFAQMAAPAGPGSTGGGPSSPPPGQAKPRRPGGGGGSKKDGGVRFEDFARQLRAE